MSKVQYVVTGGCAVITMDSPPVNSLSAAVRDGLMSSIAKAQQDRAIKAIVISGANKTFCAGAEISEFQAGPMRGADLVTIIDTIEATTKPVVAAIGGVSLGGGLEVALGCHWRVADSTAKAVLPEVNIGLLPGAGGTQRLPRLIGASPALEMMITGNMVPAGRAVKLGIYDQEVPAGDAVRAAVEFALAKATQGEDLAQRRLSCCTVPSMDPSALVTTAKKLCAKRRGQLAPSAIVKCVEAAIQCSFKEGMAVEKKEFAGLASNGQSKALQHIFFAQRLAGKVPGLSAKPLPIKKVAIVGSGLMGGGIAMSCAEAGLQVWLLDINKEALERGMGVIRSNYGRSVKSGRLPQAKVDAILQRISPVDTYEAIADVDMVVEAVFENMEVKKKVFATLDAVCKPHTLLCSNTSYLNIDEMAAATQRPQQVVGTHFFSPANVMKLLENVRGRDSSEQAVATVMAWGRSIAKVPVLVGNCHGFVGNRMLDFYSQGARLLVETGALPWEVDKVAVEFGMPMGPFQMSDLVGIDLLGRERERSGTASPATFLHDRLYAAGRYGQKNGKGYYLYDQNRKPQPDPEVEGMIVDVRKNLGITPRTVGQEEMLQTLFFTLVNEGFKILGEGIAQRPSDIDVVYCFGYGFPSYRGGPMFYADEVGLDKVLGFLEAAKVPPAPLLKDCVRAGMSLQQYWAKQESSRKAKL